MAAFFVMFLTQPLSFVTFRFFCSTLLFLTGFPLAISGRPAAGQEAGVEEGDVAAALAVKVVAESGPGTNSQRFEKIVEQIPSVESRIRACYLKAAEDDLATEGEGVYRVEVARRKSKIVAAPKGLHKQLLRCMRRSITKLKAPGLDRKAQIYLRVTLTSLAAEGIRKTRERRKEEAEVSFREIGDELEAEGGPSSGVISFLVRGPSSERESLAALYRGLRTDIPRLLDCRRKAGRRGTDPTSSTEFHVRRGSVKQKESSVRFAAARNCTKRVLKDAWKKARKNLSSKAVLTAIVQNYSDSTAKKEK